MFDISSEIKIPPFYPLCVRFFEDMFWRRNIFSVIFPVVSVKTRRRKNRNFFHQPRTALIRPSAVMPCDYNTDVYFNSIPYPSLIFFIPDITPRLISLHIYFNFQSARQQSPQARREVRINLGGIFFLSSELTVFFGNIKSFAYISDSTAVESLYFDLLLNAGLPCVISIVMLKTFPTFIAAIPLGSVFAEAIFHQVFSTAGPTFYLDILFHEPIPLILKLR